MRPLRLGILGTGIAANKLYLPAFKLLGREIELVACANRTKSKALAFAKKRPGRGTSLSYGLWFSAGVLVSFWILAGVLLAIRAGGQAVGWGFQLQDPAFVIVAALAFFLIGLNLLGVFEIGLSLTRLGSARPSGDRGHAFLGGFFATAVATPCTAPFMGAALGYALSHGAAAAFGVFTALALGMAAPFLLLSGLPGLSRRIPKPGPWMESFRQALGFPMMAAAVWMAFVLSGLAGPPALIGLLEGLLAAGLGAWAWGRWGRLERQPRVRIAAAVSALALVALGLAWSTRGAGPAVAAPIASASGGAPSVAAPRPADPFWRPWSEETLADLRQRGLPVFVDFTAAWCLSCQVNDAVALSDKAVRERFASLGIQALKADWTAKDEAIARALEGLGRASVPLYALYVPGRPEPVILPEILTPGIVLRYLDKSAEPKR